MWSFWNCGLETSCSKLPGKGQPGKQGRFRRSLGHTLTQGLQERGTGICTVRVPSVETCMWQKAHTFPPRAYINVGSSVWAAGCLSNWNRLERRCIQKTKKGWFSINWFKKGTELEELVRIGVTLMRQLWAGNIDLRVIAFWQEARQERDGKRNRRLEKG